MNAVQGLKLLAAVMGVLIIGAISLLGYGVYSKLGDGGKAETAAENPAAPAVAPPMAPPVAGGTAPAPAPMPALATAGPLDLDQPDGSRIVDASTSGPLLTLRLEGGGLPDRVAVIDLRNDTVVRWVHSGATPPR